jgi:hypothetical protein
MKCWSNIYQFASILLIPMAIMACQQRYRRDYSHTRPYEPLAAVSVGVDPRRAVEFTRELRQFASRNNYEYVGDDFGPTFGIGRVNAVVWVGKDSYFDATNLATGSKLIMIAHSHEAQSVWRSPWKRLLAEMRSQFQVIDLPITNKGVSGI